MYHAIAVNPSGKSGFQAPPNELHNYDSEGSRPVLPLQPNSTECTVEGQRLCYEAAIEALDTEVGRLLDNLPQGVLDNTLIIFVGDNGTPGEVTVPPFNPDHAKIMLYEGGINVPLIISGAGVVDPGRESAALVNTTDLFATILETAGVNVATAPCFAGVQLDSVSLVPIIKNTASDPHRESVFSDQFRQRGSGNVNDGQTVRNREGFKLIHFPNSETTNKLELYDLLVDPFEEEDLYDDELPFLDGPQRLSFQELCDQLESLLEDPSVCPLPPLPGATPVP